MKVKTLSVLAGISAPLIMTAPADAGFVGISTTAKPNSFNLYVVNVYADFDNPGNDAMESVAGTPGNPLLISVVGGSFWNHPIGTDLAPSAFALVFYPSLAYDTFVTIGVKMVGVGGQPVDGTTLVNFPRPIAGTSISTSNGSWAILGPLPQGNPFDPINSFPGDGRVLIGQFSMEIPADTPYGITGEFLMGFVSDGVDVAGYGTFSSIVPTPGALGFIGLAGLLSTRRRHR
jgi:hypothetical protein